MILLHVEPSNRTGHNRIVHLAEKSSSQTLCGWNMRTGKSFGGHEVFRVTETTKSMSCDKCKVRLRMRIEQIIRGQKGAALEETYAFLTLNTREVK